MIGDTIGTKGFIKTSTNKQACEYCGKLPENRYSHNAALHTGFKYAQTRMNRTKLVWIPEELKPVYNDRLGKKLCNICYQEVLDSINKVSEDRINRISDSMSR